MEAEQAEIGLAGLPTGRGDEIGERAADALSSTREAGQGYPAARDIEPDGARLIEDMEVRVGGEQGKGQCRSFVVAEYQHHRDPGVGHLEQRFEGETDKLGRYFGSEQEIAAVDDEIDLAAPGGGQRGAGVGEEVGAATPTLDSWSKGKVETEVGIGQQEDAESQSAVDLVSRRWRS